MAKQAQIDPKISLKIEKPVPMTLQERSRAIEEEVNHLQQKYPYADDMTLHKAAGQIVSAAEFHGIRSQEYRLLQSLAIDMVNNSNIKRSEAAALRRAGL